MCLTGSKFHPEAPQSICVTKDKEDILEYGVERSIPSEAQGEKKKDRKQWDSFFKLLNKKFLTIRFYIQQKIYWEFDQNKITFRQKRAREFHHCRPALVQILKLVLQQK